MRRGARAHILIPVPFPCPFVPISYAERRYSDAIPTHLRARCVPRPCRLRCRRRRRHVAARESAPDELQRRCPSRRAGRDGSRQRRRHDQRLDRRRLRHDADRKFAAGRVRAGSHLHEQARVLRDGDQPDRDQVRDQVLLRQSLHAACERRRRRRYDPQLVQRIDRPHGDVVQPCWHAARETATRTSTSRVRPATSPQC